jgi:sec-independent protein translocase protein TatB
MLGFGWTEMLVLGVIALIVIGPKELPALMQKLGRFAGTVRRMGADFQREISKSTGLDEVRSLRNSITQPLKTTTDAIRREFNTTTPSGEVKPSGALAPADPKAESVVNEIHAAAGMKAPARFVPGRAEALPKPARKSAAESKALPGPAAPATVPVRAKRVTRAKPAPSSPVAVADLEPVPPEPQQAPAASPVAAPKPARRASSKGAATPAAAPATAKRTAGKSTPIVPPDSKAGTAETQTTGRRRAPAKKT